MNLSDVAQVVDIVSKIAGIFIPIGVLWIAYRELGKWRRELIGKNQVELAQRMGRLAVRFRGQFEYAVDYRFVGSEVEDRPSENSENLERKYYLNQRYARQKRIKTLYEMLTELSEANIEAELIFEKDLSSFLQIFKDATMHLDTTLNEYFHLEIDGFGSSEDVDKFDELKAVAYGKDTNLLSQVNTATKEMLDYIKGYLRK